MALDIVPARELGRPRIDAVVQVTGTYRDQFEGFMRLLADAIERLSKLDEPRNTVAANTHAAATGPSSWRPTASRISSCSPGAK